MTRIAVKPELLRWACERSRIDDLELCSRFPQVNAWERGEKLPTLKQLEAFAKATHTPVGYFFLPEPPVELLPIRDFRTVRQDVARPSVDLLDTIYAMQRRQDWLRDERREGEGEPLDFVGNARLADDPEAVGREMRRIVSRETFFKFYQDYTQRERDRAKPMGGGDFYNNQNTRVGQTFALAVMRPRSRGA